MRGVVFLGAGGAVVALDQALNQLSMFTFPRVVEHLSLDVNRLYVSDAAGFCAIDTKNPAAMTLLGTYSGAIDAISFAGGVAYVMDGTTLHILNAEDATAISIIGSLSFPVNPEALRMAHTQLTLTNNLLYVIVGNTLFVVDVSSPAHPSLLSSYGDGQEELKALAASGNLVYIGIGQNLEILDLSKPSQLSSVSRHRVGPAHFPDFQSFFVSGNYLYIADSSEGLWVVDVIDPFTPRDLGAFFSCCAWDVYHDGKRIYFTVLNQGLLALDSTDPTLGIYTFEETSDISISKGIAGVLQWTQQERLQLMRINKTDPPQILGSLPVNGMRVKLSEKRACVADIFRATIALFDISNPSMPVQTAVYEDGSISGLTFNQGLFITDTLLAYSTAENGIYFIDISNPTQPIQIGQLLGKKNGVHIEGSMLYTLQDNELVFIDITNPGQSQQIGAINVGQNNRGFKVWGDRACVYGETSCQIIDISNPAAPTTIGSIQTDATILQLEHEGTYIYIFGKIGDFYKIKVLDISNPADLHQAGELISNQNVSEFGIEEGRAYIAAGHMGFKILDLSNVEKLTTIQPYHTPGTLVDICYADKRLYAVCDSGLDGSWIKGFYSFQASNPSSIEIIGFYEFKWGHECPVIRVSGDFAYGQSNRGLEAFDVSNPAKPLYLTTVAQPVQPSALNTVLISGQRIYLKGASDTIDIFDISSPSAPVYLRSMERINQFTIHETTAAASFQSEANTEIKIIDLANLQNPRSGNFANSEKIEAIAYDGRYVFLITSKAVELQNSYAFRILDVTIPESPSQIGVYAFASSFSPFSAGPNIHLAGNKAYISGVQNGLHVIDISTPANPKEKKIYDTPGDSYQISLSDENIYIADGRGGIAVLGEKPIDPINPAKKNSGCFISTIF